MIYDVRTIAAVRDFLKDLEASNTIFKEHREERIINQSFGHLLAQVAESQVGVQEEGGENRGSKIVEYQKATWLDPGAWPWCAAFVCWSVREAQKLAIKQETPTDFKSPRTAGAWDFEKWATNRHPWKNQAMKRASSEKVRLIKPPRDFQVGDVAVFTFSHIGIIVGTEGGISTVEGNTNKEGSREGDGVWRRTRPKSKIRSVIRVLS